MKDLTITLPYNIASQVYVNIVIWIIFFKSAGTSETHDLIAVLGVIGSLVLLFYDINKYLISSRVYFMIAGYAILLFANFLLVGEVRSVAILVTRIFSCFPIAMYLFYEDELYVPLWMTNTIIFSAYVMYRLALSIDGYQLFYGTSRNYVSALVLVYIAILGIVLKKNFREIPLWMAFFFFMCCVVAVGRGGIVTACFLLIGFYYYYFFRKNSDYRLIKFTVGIVIVIVIALYVTKNTEYILANYFTRFGTSSAEWSTKDRLNNWSLYLLQMKNPVSLLIGVDTYSLLRTSLNGNLHNSYLMTHAYCGIVGFIVSLYAVIKSVILGFKEGSFTYSVVIAAFMLRAVTDWMFPSGIAGIIVWYLLITVSENTEYNIG